MTNPDPGPAPARAADRPARLSVGVVGAGRVGAVLGAALELAGHRVVAASGVSAASQARADDLLHGLTLTDPFTVAGQVDLLLLAVPDDVLPTLVDGFADALAVRAGTLVAHTSGRYGVGVSTR